MASALTPVLESPLRCIRHDDAARLLGYHAAYLARRDVRDKLGIPYFYVGGSVRYDSAQLLAWLEAQRAANGVNGAA